MKKVLKLIISLILTASFLLLAVACGDEVNLATPANLLVDEDLKLSWSAVKNARSYRVEIVNTTSNERLESIAQRTSYSLKDLTEGDYEIRLRSVGGSSNDVFSEWTEKFDFHRDKDSGLMFRYVNGNTEYEVMSAGSAGGDLVIEDVYRGKKVVGSGERACSGGTKVRNVVIPESVTYIGSGAFYNCSSLVSVEIPETVTYIGFGAFQQCSGLTKVNIPEAVTTIETFTFAYCRSLVNLTLSANTVSIGESAFSNCSGLVEFSVPDAVQTIGRNAFNSATALKKVTFGSSLETIGANAFNSCTALEKVEFAELKGELKIGEAAFAVNPALNEVELPRGLTDIPKACFAADTALDKITIPDTVTSIGTDAFTSSKLYSDQMNAEDGDGLVYADKWIVNATPEFKKTVEVIDEYTFREGTVGIAVAPFIYKREIEVEDEEGNIKKEQELVSCENLKRIRFPHTLKYVGAQAFYHTPNLQRMLATYENSLVSVGMYAFAECPMLNNVQFANGLKEIDTRAFFRSELVDYNDNNPELLIPSTVTRVGENAFFGTALWDRKDITDGVVYAGNWIVGYHIDPTERDQNKPSSIVEIRENTVGICDYAFYADMYLQNITGLHNVDIIGKGAFAWCMSLSTVNLSRNLKTIEDYTFYRCEKIYMVTFPTMLQSIGRAAFYGCKQLSEVNLLETQTKTIGRSAFRGCRDLLSLELGETVESIGQYAFYDCVSLMGSGELGKNKQLVIPDSVTELGKRAFGNCTSVHAVKIGSGLKEISDYAFIGCIWLMELEIPATVKKVGNYAFYNCERLQSLTIREGVEEIGHYAFYGNTALTHVEFPASVKSIGLYAFKGCTLLTSVLFKGTPVLIDENAFYGCPRLTVYSVGAGAGEGWSTLWNSSQRPVVWGVTLSEEGYVVSVKVEGLSYLHAYFGCMGPYREGYIFVGWTEEEGSTTAQYTAGQFEEIPAGTTVYPVWEKAPEAWEDESWWEEFLIWYDEMITALKEKDNPSA